jgi:hypothetical protein
MGIVPTLDCTPDTTRHRSAFLTMMRTSDAQHTMPMPHLLPDYSCIIIDRIHLGIHIISGALCEICLRGKKLKLYGFTKGSTTLVSQ